MVDAKLIAKAGTPTLLIDTCSILDVMRDPTREKPHIHEWQAGLELLVATENGTLASVAAQQVMLEFAEHDLSVQSEAQRAVHKLCRQIERLNQISASLGSNVSVNLAHLDDHVAKTRDVVDRWLKGLVVYTPNGKIYEAAITRMNANIAPARRGKESTKDCIIFETYLETSKALRDAGLIAPIVFVSSNTSEYLTDGNVLKGEIVRDMAPLKIGYAANMAMAKHLLGL